MKKFFIHGTLLFFSFFLCDTETVAQQRNLEQIESIVLNHKKKNNFPSYYSNRIKSSEIINKSELSSGKEAFYVYRTHESGQNSFVIVSGDERMPEILAYSFENEFNIDNVPPAVRYWLNSYVNEFNNLNSNTEDFDKPKISISGEGVAPILDQIQWGQSQPYNNLCPFYNGVKTLTGCVATAMAQVMRYYSFPERGFGSVSYKTSTNHISITHDFSKDVFDWSNMLSSYSVDYTDQQAKSVAELMASCGAAVKMDYGTASQGGSGAYQSDLLSGYINYFGYDKDASLVIRSFCSTDDWHRLLINELNLGRPVNYGGATAREGGHSFIIDGYRIGENEYPDYHVNWGWDGSCDGYYQIANLHPQEDGIYATNYPFSESQQMTIGVMPEDGVCSNYSLLLSSKVNCSLSKIKIGSTLICKISSLYNCSYKKFSGMISVALKTESGELIIIGEGIKRDLEYCEGTGSISISGKISDNIIVGDYSVCLVYKLEYSDSWNEVLSTSYAKIEVTEDCEEEIETKNMWTEIGCSEVELLDGESKNILAANVYELINLETAPFKGYLTFTITDENCIPLFSFGTSGEMFEIGYRDYMTEPIYVSGVIDGNLPDGHYRLYLSARNYNQELGPFVVQNDLSLPDAQTKELYYRVNVRNGIAYIDGHEYLITPLDIREININDFCDITQYSLDGKLIKNKNNEKGVYVLRKTKRAVKVLFP